jgi:hypothetical protein
MSVLALPPRMFPTVSLGGLMKGNRQKVRVDNLWIVGGGRLKIRSQRTMSGA